MLPWAPIKRFHIWFDYRKNTGDKIMYDLIWEREFFPPRISNAGTKKVISPGISVTLFRSLWEKRAEKTRKKK